MEREYQKNRASPFGVELFEGVRQWGAFLGVCALLFLASLSLEYHAYTAFNTPNLAKEPQEIYAQVIAQYQKSKEGKPPYWVLKLKAQSGAILYATSKEDLKDISNRYVRLWGVGGGKGFECGFYEYLRSCFFNAYRISLLHERDYRDYIRGWIELQHENANIAALYKTLFIADFLPVVWRDMSNKLGIAHIIAISGFHLGILSLVIGGVLHWVYGRFHHHFSYRNKFYDIGALVLVSMFAYLVVLDFTPSFLRAFVMAAFGLYLLYSGVNLLSFRLLFAVVCVCVALFPRLIFSIGFALSVFGVFFIYLFVRYFGSLEAKFGSKFSESRLDSEADSEMSESSRASLRRVCGHIWGRVWAKVYTFLLVPLYFNSVIFVNMLPIVHWYFPYFTPLSLISIPLTLGFVVFFPLVMALHAIGLGFVFDGFFAWCEGLEIESIEFYMPWWGFSAFVALCALAIKSKNAYRLLNLVSFGFFAFLCARFYAVV